MIVRVQVRRRRGLGVFSFDYFAGIGKHGSLLRGAFVMCNCNSFSVRRVWFDWKHRFKGEDTHEFPMFILLMFFGRVSAVGSR